MLGSAYSCCPVDPFGNDISAIKREVSHCIFVGVIVIENRTYSGGHTSGLCGNGSRSCHVFRFKNHF